MNMNEHVHIGMPVYNGETHLAEALDSLLNQTYDNFEIFLVDNASTDGTPEIAKMYAQRDKRLKYFRMTDWLCATDNWRRTFELAAPDPDFFMWASHDDLWAKQYIERLLPPLLDQPAVVLSLSQVDKIDSQGQVIGHLYHNKHLGGGTAFQRIRSLFNRGGHSAIYGLMRSQAIRGRVSCCETCFGSDLWFLIQLATVGRFYMVKEVLFFKRLGGISQTGQDPSASLDPESTWTIGRAEWELIDQLSLTYPSKLYTYFMLRVISKLLFPRDKRIEWFMMPIFWWRLIRRNPHSLGLRSRLRQYRFSESKKSRSAQQERDMKPPQVSIALPVYNGEDHLFDALMSFKNQTYPYFELIICDNASTDATPKIAEEFSRSDHRFVHARETDHVDAYKSFLRAYSLSNRSRKYFLWACDDNVWAPTFLEKTVGYMESHSECVLCGFYLHHFRDNGQISYRNYVPIPWYFEKARLLQFLFERRVGYSIYGLMRRSAIDTIRLQFDCRCYFDTWIVLQMRTLGTIHVIQEDLLAFRSGGSSTTKDDPYVANVIDLIFTEQEMEILLSLDRLSALEKVVLAQKMAYIARRHRKPDTSSRWWLSLAQLAAGIKNGFEQTRHSS